MAARDFGVDYLQAQLDGEITLAKHIGVVVDTANDDTVVLRAPLEPNGNHKGSAFGGSLYSISVLGGWWRLTPFRGGNGLEGDAVIQESPTQYLPPVLGELRASLLTPDAAD